MHRRLVHLLLVLLLVFVCSVLAYIPALPSNVTVSTDPLNATRPSRLHLQWYSNGSLWNDVSYQLVGADSTGITQGALVHISESHMSNLTLPTITPWIALISCDDNATNASLAEDIFTLARDKGAVSALLYTQYSETCIINPEYADPDLFEQVLDIFSTPSLIATRIIAYQFGQYGTSNETVYTYYDSQMLNQSFTVINESVTNGNPVAPGYLIATLQAFNATPTGNPSDGGAGSQNTQPPNGDSGNTGLAMIILYAITGCVSALFCVVIVSGAIRAIRHPERYGPRMAVHQGGVATSGQSRARGLTRAILDTFPVVKFGSSSDTNTNVPPVAVKDVEAHSESSPRPDTSENAAMEMQGWETVDSVKIDADGVDPERRISTVSRSPGRDVTTDEEHDDRHESSGSRGTTRNSVRRSSAGTEASQSDNRGEGPSRPSKPRNSIEQEDVMPDAIGRETCPICIVAFAEGDDLRLLPCEGKHRFHQQCVDPWLLELSSSCPICRQDFLALENMLWGESSESEHPYPLDDRGSRRTSAPASASQGNRFSRYLRSARRRNRENSTNSSSYAPQTGT